MGESLLARKDRAALLKKSSELSLLFGSLAHPVRLRVLCSLSEGEKTVTELTEFCEISQPAMSQFLSRMREEGIVRSRKDGTRVFYSITDAQVGRLLAAVRNIYC
jgi:DNA-binding transcriptional ArsR family regulator